MIIRAILVGITTGIIKPTAAYRSCLQMRLKIGWICKKKKNSNETHGILQRHIPVVVSEWTPLLKGVAMTTVSGTMPSRFI